MPQLTVSKNDNKVNLEALVDKANGREIVILGQSPTLLGLDSKIMSFIKSKFVVGLNSVYFHYVPDLIMSSYLSEIIRARKALPDRTKIIHTRNIYEKPLIENIMTVRRLDFDGTLNSEFGDTPSLKTRNNIALMATSLAYILKAKNIFYMGVDLNDKGYYYDKVQKYKEMHDQSFNSKSYK